MLNHSEVAEPLRVPLESGKGKRMFQFVDSSKASPLGFGARSRLQDSQRGEGGVTEPVAGLLACYRPFPLPLNNRNSGFIQAHRPASYANRVHHLTLSCQ